MLTLLTGTTPLGAGSSGSISIATGDSLAGAAGGLSLRVGTAASGLGGDVRLAAGEAQAVNGIGGSIGPAGTCKIFEHLQLNWRSFIDWGGGNGRVIIAAGCSGAINACAVERPENSGYYSIYRAALKLLDYPEFNDLKEKISFDLRDKLMPVDIDKVVYLNSFSFTFCT